MIMNTMCTRRGNIVTHDMREEGLREPVCKKIEISVASTEKQITQYDTIGWTVIKRCKCCGDGGRFDQDNNAIEYYQPNNIKT